MRKFWLSLVVLSSLAWLMTWPAAPAQAQARLAPTRPAPTRPVIVLTMDGALTPSMVQYVQRGLVIAERDQAELVILKLNTPGGGVTLMNQMVQNLRASPVPVVVYVAPRGAMAGSAGTVITLAGHAAAMAPETAIGAASPVSLQGQDLAETEAAKEINIMKATVRSLAARRSEAAIRLAEQTIESAQAASAQEALEVGLVDFIAQDIPDLLRQLDGFSVQMETGERTIDAAYLQAEDLPPTLFEQILALLTNPNIVFLLLLVGLQAILIEIASPGGWVAGFLGVVCVALSTYGLGILPVNWFGIIFMITAFVLFILDIKAPTHGALTVAGVASLIVGSLVLFNSPGVPGFQRVSVPLIVGVSAASGGLFFAVLLFALRAQKTPLQTGRETLVGQIGLARTDLAPTGMVQVASEQWSAELASGTAPVPQGSQVEVVKVSGLRLIVRQVKSSE